MSLRRFVTAYRFFISLDSSTLSSCTVTLWDIQDYFSLFDTIFDENTLKHFYDSYSFYNSPFLCKKLFNI